MNKRQQSVIESAYHRLVPMTLRLSNRDHELLRARADIDGISVHEAARCAVREYLTRAGHHSRVATAVEAITTAHADALERLGR